MAVEIKIVGLYNDGETVFEATDLETLEPIVVKNFHEKSKDKWHIVLAQNSANRKYISHSEFNSKASEDGIYTVEDKTSGPRSLGTSQPDKKLVPYMTEEDKAKYDAIIARAVENKNAQTNVELSEEEKLEAQIAKLQAKLEAKKASN